jgi:DNA mismatch endonuclease (patch repair protein)
LDFLGRIGMANKNTQNPLPSSQSAHDRMRATRRKNTHPEIALQTLLRNEKIEFETENLLLIGYKRKVDIIIKGKKVAIFVDGCFWHGCPIHGTWPKQNAEFWRDKIIQNQQRDRDTDQKLLDAGWRVIRIWEHEDMVLAVERISREIKNFDSEETIKK